MASFHKSVRQMTKMSQRKKKQIGGAEIRELF